MRIPTVTFLCMFVFVDRPTCLYVKYVICRKNRYYFITYRIFLPFLLRKFKRLDFRNTTKHFPELKSTNHGKIFPQITELKSIFHGILQKPDFAGSIAGSNSGGSQLFSVCLWVQKDD